MGMFDWVKCEYPLPGTPLKYVNIFQTKDSRCYLDCITITAEGKLVIHDMDGYVVSDLNTDFTDEMLFYNANTVAVNQFGSYTAEGEDAESVAYVAEFKEGQLINIKQTGYTIKPSKPVSEFWRDFHGENKARASDATKDSPNN